MTKEKDLTFQGEIQRLKKTINIQAKDYIELKQENEKLKEENALLKEQLLTKSEQEQSFQSLLEENRCLHESIDGAQIIINGYIELTGKYKSALEEIKNVVQYPYKTPHGDSLSAYVVNKIIEVLK